MTTEASSPLVELRERLPDWARDLRLNLGSLESGSSLTPPQLWGAALASAIAARSPELTSAIEVEASAHLDETALTAARSAAAIMGMNNVYYRFVHLVQDEEYGRMPPRLRVQGLARHGAPALDFELWALAVSAVNGCGKCIEAHEHELREKGATRQNVQDAVRVAAVVAAVASIT